MRTAYSRFVRTLLISLSMCGAILLAYAGEYIRFEKLVPQIDGQAILGISSIMQCREGYMWFCSDQGLIRYDGYEFSAFVPSSDSPDTGSGFPVYTVFEDRRGIIWVGTQGAGLYGFDKAKSRFSEHYPVQDEASFLNEDIILAIEEDRSGNLWVGTRFRGLYRRESGSDRFIHVALNGEGSPASQVYPIWALCLDREGFLWIGTEKEGLFRLDPETRDTAHFEHDPRDAGSLSSNSVWSLHEDSAGALWVGTSRGGLNRLDKRTGSFERLDLSSRKDRDLTRGSITAIREDGAGRLWIGSSLFGLTVLDRSAGTFSSFGFDPDDPESLSNDIVSAICIDMSGIAWIGTARGGINRSLINLAKFFHFKHNAYDRQSLPHSDVHAILPHSSGKLFIGTEAGMTVIDERDDTVLSRSSSLSVRGEESRPRISTLCEGEGGRVWIGSQGGGLKHYDPDEDKISEFPIRDGRGSASAPHNINALHIDKESRRILWIGTDDGLVQLSVHTGHVTRFRHSDDPQSLSGNQISAICEDGQGSLWIGTRGKGLNRFEKKSGESVRFQFDPLNPSPKQISHNVVTCVLEDRTGRIWIGTEKGLSSIDSDNQTWSHYDDGQGFASAHICALLEEGERLWISTTRGLYRFDTGTEEYMFFDLTDGIQGFVFNPGAAAGDSSGQLYFGGTNGFNRFLPADITTHPFVPPIVVSGIYKLDDNQRFRISLEPAKSLRLSPSEPVSVEFASLCYVDPLRIQYAYMLEGLDEEWIFSGTERAVSYSGLDPGDYVLRVRGTNHDGRWNEEGVSVPIFVASSFRASGWIPALAALMAVAAAAVAAFLFRRRSGHIRSEIMGDPDSIGKKYDLTKRELEVLQLLMDGLKTVKIGEKLFISENTVRNHVYSIYRKMNVTNRLELANRVRNHR